MELSSTIVSIPIVELVEDWNIYPRRNVDESHISNLCKALEAGESLPPVVADASSKRLTDGWHRSRAHARVFGIGSEISVELRLYTNEGEMILDAIAMNATHGRPLDKQDMTHSAIMASSAGITPLRIAAAMRQPESDIRKLIVRVATVPVGSPGTIPGTVMVALKRPALHLAGMQLTREQAEAHATAPGVSYVLTFRQAREGVEFGLANFADRYVVEEARRLRDALNRFFESE